MHIIKHFLTITKHRHYVISHCFKAGIGFQGLFHDLSKYSPSEFIIGAKFYVGTRSPNDMERRVFGMSKAWIHHKGRNKHHFEYWYDYDLITKQIVAVKMPLKYVKEMFCDRLAASKTYLGDEYNDSSSLDYFMNSRAKNYMHKDNSKLLEEWLLILSQKGEKEAFAHIRKIKNEKGV